MNTVAVVLLNFNSTRLTKKCVQSIQESKDKDLQCKILVWDNDSTQTPKTADFPGCELVLSKKNLGFAGGYNNAIVRATHLFKPDYLLVLNNDTRVSPGMVEKLIATFKKSEDVGAVVPKIYFEKGHEFHESDYSKDERGKVIWYAGGEIDWANMIPFHIGVDEVDRGQFESVMNVEFASGCCFLTTPKIWKTMGGFDEKYFMYFEDVDWSLRLRRKGLQIYYLPEAHMYHLNAGSTGGSGSPIHNYYQSRNRLRFGLRFGSLRTRLALLKEAKNIYERGTKEERLGILDALEGRWGKH
ncbi:MAG TPA: glycosyltransferase family 2 protein [Patescibacteria group bacterium]|nr:glycosyltransferase family 2 protein [Patescibacteria group bacterium]